MKISIIIPLYNESGNIEALYNELKKTMSDFDYEIIAVNDGSKDNTLQLLKRIASNDKSFKVLNLSRNFGQSAALQAGFKYAEGDLIATLDGDMQNMPQDIINLYNKLVEDKCDMVVGWRKNRLDPLFAKVIPSKIANKLISKFLNLNIHDTGCSLKIFKSEYLNEFKLYGEMHRFIPYIMFARGADISEIEVTHRRRFKGKSKYGFSRSIKVILDMFTVKFLNEYSTNPIYAIGGFSVISFLLSIVSFIILLLMKVFLNFNMTGNPFLIIAVFLFLVSIQLMMFGLISEILVRTYFESNNKEIFKIKDFINVDKKQ